MAGENQVFDTLRMSPKDIQRLVEDLERRTSEENPGAHRQTRRWRMRMQRVIVTLVGQMGQRLNLLVIPRNLSQGGMGFVCGNYLHVGSQCFITLRTLGGKGVVVPGIVRRCRYLEGRLHDVGVEFSERIDPRNFMIDTSGQHLFNAERVEISELKGTVLVVNGEPLEQRLLGHYFSESAIDVVFASTAAQAWQMMEIRPDMLFVDASLPDQCGFTFLAEIRERGFKNPVVMLSAENDQKLRAHAFDHGANEILFKPVPAELIHRAAAEYLIAAAEQRKLAESSMAKIEQAVGIGRQERTDYAKELRLVADSIAEALEAGDAKTVRTKILMLKASAPGFGFPAVAQMAETALVTMDQSRDQEAVQQEMHRLVRNLKTVNAA